MMEINFRFDTDNEQDMIEYEIFSKSKEMYKALYDIKYELRNLYKYENSYDQDTICHLYEIILDEITDAGIEL